jgi:O-antigen/teichoic acid export membrane protein
LVSNYQALTYWYIRRKQFKRISLNRILQTTFYSVTAIIYALIARRNSNITFNGLVFSQLVAQSVVLLLFFIDYITDYKKSGYEVQLKSLLAVAKRYIHFPKVTIFSGLINGISTRIPQILLQFFFGDVVVGHYSFTNRLLATPVSLVSSAIGDVFRQRASEEYASQGQCRDTYKKIFKGLSVFSIVAFVAIGAVAPWVFRVLFNGKWAVAGIYISIMSVLYMVRFVASPLSFMLIITEKLKQDLIWQACLLASTVAISAVGFYLTGNDLVVILLFTVVSTIAYLVNLYMTRKLSLGGKQTNNG